MLSLSPSSSCALEQTVLPFSSCFSLPAVVEREQRENRHRRVIVKPYSSREPYPSRRAASRAASRAENQAEPSRAEPS
uniref:Uncharacterized protein n=1 Tax=Cucumis melo TaxID=3656 RepID=A0A9I9CD47_CUCME